MKQGKGFLLMEFHKLSNGGELFLDREALQVSAYFFYFSSLLILISPLQIKEASFYIIPGCVYFRKTIKHSA